MTWTVLLYYPERTETERHHNVTSFTISENGSRTDVHLEKTVGFTDKSTATEVQATVLPQSDHPPENPVDRSVDEIIEDAFDLVEEWETILDDDKIDRQDHIVDAVQEELDHIDTRNEHWEFYKYVVEEAKKRG